MTAKPPLVRRPLCALVLLALGGGSGQAWAQSQDFTLGVLHAVTFTPFFPNGTIDSTPPYTMCRNNGMTLRLIYTWRKDYGEQVRTDPIGTWYPYYFTQGISPNPVYLPPMQPGNATTRQVDVGMITGPVNTVGVRTVSLRGSGILYPGQTGTATVNVLVETQFEPSSTRYREIVDGTFDMPTQPWFGWTQDLAATSYRLDVARCSSQAAQPPLNCGGSSMPFQPLNNVCNGSDYCWVGSTPAHQTATPLLPNTNYQYRVLGRNTCGNSDEQTATPPRPAFRTAQACFTSGGFVPDGGFAEFDAATLGLNPGASIVNLRATVHMDHPRVSDLRISLSKTAPDPRGPVVLLDPMTTGGNCDGRRIQAAFGQGGFWPPNSCRAGEPALGGLLSPAQSLGAFEQAPATLAAGNWRLRVEDTVANGQAGILREWCLSADVALSPTTYLQDDVWLDGFEPRN